MLKKKITLEKSKMPAEKVSNLPIKESFSTTEDKNVLFIIEEKPSIRAISIETTIPKTADTT